MSETLLMIPFFHNNDSVNINSGNFYQPWIKAATLYNFFDLYHYLSAAVFSRLSNGGSLKRSDLIFNRNISIFIGIASS
ncbi:hypothetical protein SAMN04515624_10980 [Eubacterium maltosivorans]|nr:hypothetical protein EUMA32_05660 [Eubacterium maltosivorans]SDP34048.1 hypothetical protein SAMN04515624_10980 [Eubacterium maltosivorans]